MSLAGPLEDPRPSGMCPCCHLVGDDCDESGSVKMWCGAMVKHSEMVDGRHPDHDPYRTLCCMEASRRSLDRPLGHPRSVGPAETECDRLRDRSGRVTDRRPLVGLLYELLRDHVPPSVLEELVRDQIDMQFDFSNGWMALYAQDLASRLSDVDNIENAFSDACRSLTRVPTFEGWRKGERGYIYLRISMTRQGDLIQFTVTGSCRRQADDAPFDIGVIILEKTEQELYAYGDLAQFFSSYIVDQSFVLAEAKWIKSQEGAE